MAVVTRILWACLQPFGVGAAIAYGGQHLGPALEAFSKHNKSLSEQYAHESSLAGKLGAHTRRDIESLNQKNNAAREIMQIDKQILAAKIRVDIAQQEMDNAQTQIDNALQIEDLLRTRFTNQDLYGWMAGEISSVYFQAYQMAYDLARKAERSFRFERGLTVSNFIQFGQWDSLHKGLLAGEQLHLALKRLEAAYQDQNRREYEITKHLSLQLFDPLALIALKQTGQCEISLPESLFDADYPGHYMRRLKSVSLTLPCVVGPYTGVNCTLTLLNNKTRIKPIVGAQYSESTDEDDDRFVTNFASLQSIATSNAQNDSGLFELNFRDERYLPFEGAGAISRWRVELPRDTNAFDLNTLTDVVMHLRYTARDGGEILKNAARAAMKETINSIETSPLMRSFSARHEFPDEWYRFLHPTDPNAASQKMTFDLSSERFPYLFRGREISIFNLDLFLIFRDFKDTDVYDGGSPLQISITPEGRSAASGSLAGRPGFLAGTPHLQATVDLTSPTSLALEVSEDDVKKIAKTLTELVPPTTPNHVRLNASRIEDIVIVAHYSVGR